MNTEAMLAVADVIEYVEERFDLTTWIASDYEENGLPKIKTLWDDCGTVGCVAGWTCAWADVVPNADRWDDGRVISAARRELGLTLGQAEQLFFYHYNTVWSRVASEYGWKLGFHGGLSHVRQVTAAQAADVLRRLARGEIKL